jgi:hypothetical protein
MPREKGFMGFGDDRSDDDAYKEGRRESRSAGIADDLGYMYPKSIEEFVDNTFGGDPRSSQVKAFDAGWEDGKKERGSYSSPKPKKERNQNYDGGGGYGGGGGETSAGGGIVAVLVLVGVIGLCVYAYNEGARVSKNPTAVTTQFGTSTHRFFVETRDNSGLHLRSQKSLDSSSVVFAPEGSEVQILYFDNQQDKVKGRVGRWCRARYNGKEGWAWGWYLTER